MDPDLTVVYYTSNREKPEFEARIQRRLLDTIGDLPLISVSQKPMDFGQNICVGDIGPSNCNYARQLAIGVDAASTRFVCVAESDFLYPDAYFHFRPTRDDAIFFADHLYIVHERGRRRDWFYPRPWSGGALVASQTHMRDVCQNLWTIDQNGQERLRPLHRMGPVEMFHTEIPIVTFKTGKNMHNQGPVLRTKPLVDVLPHWGTLADLKGAYLAC